MLDSLSSPATQIKTKTSWTLARCSVYDLLTKLHNLCSYRRDYGNNTPPYLPSMKHFLCDCHGTCAQQRILKRGRPLCQLYQQALHEECSLLGLCWCTLSYNTQEMYCACLSHKVLRPRAQLFCLTGHTPEWTRQSNVRAGACIEEIQTMHMNG